MIRRLGSVVLATALLAACSALDSALDSVGVGVRSAGGIGDSLPDALTDASVQAELPRTPPRAVAEPPLPRRKPDDGTVVARREFNPDLLVGLDFDATKALLGDPALQLEEPPAKIWAYNGGSCMLNVFFYPSVGDAVFRVLTYEVRGGEIKQGAPAVNLQAAAKISDKDSPKIRRCFADLLQGRDLPDAG